MAEFNGVIQSFRSGQMISNGSIWMPEWVEFVLVGSEANQMNIWLADESFAAQYDEYIIEIVHPIIPYDDFFKDPLIVKQLLDDYDLVEKIEEVQAKRAQYPYTHQRAFMFEYHNPRDDSMRFPAYWIAIVYGEAGNNPDLIKDKIVEELLADSAHPRTDWEVILPDLFMTTEFIFTPFWNQYSIEQADYRAGTYSPTVDHRKRLPLIRRTARGPGYTQTYVDNKFELSSNTYKSIAFSVLGNPQNRNGITQFSQKFKDYQLVTNDTGDINKSSPETIEWMMLFSKLLKAAEGMTRYSSVPQGVSRMIRDNVIYASAYFKNVNYMVVAKASVEELS
ncbi:virion structural protein [Pseudomonas phage PA1C]|nr:virion structural protein [Pseudomonas phage PA1C]